MAVTLRFEKMLTLNRDGLIIKVRRGRRRDSRRHRRTGRLDQLPTGTVSAATGL
jgi:hypothetical protein